MAESCPQLAKPAELAKPAKLTNWLEQIIKMIRYPASFSLPDYERRLIVHTSWIANCAGIDERYQHYRAAV